MVAAAMTRTTTILTIAMLSFVSACDRDRDREKEKERERPAPATSATSTTTMTGATKDTSTTTTTGATNAPNVGVTVKSMVVATPDKITWGDAPPMFEQGAKMAVIEGDPATPNALFTVRLKMPPGYKIMPHTHPTDEHVTVLSGTFHAGHGDSFAREQMTDLPTQSYVAIPAQHHHYAAAGTTETIVQVHAVGPFALTYINPSDDPRNRKK